ncbi:uncharacterized protein LOC141725810 [Zonotrichia albicollis]|uniref:uncharacterized protein LOC141725810 n=1 Tax=Zonotrichia albicollis TaxID=44394 RepID=UPI003D811860
MEPLELSPALLQPQDSAVAILGELLATLPRENETLPESPGCLYLDVVKFTRELRATLYRNDDTWWSHNVTVDGDDPVTCLSRALATYRTTPPTTWRRVTQAAWDWKWSVSGLVDSWAELAKKATKLHNTCRDLATKAANRAATANARVRELQDAAARDGTTLEQWEEQGQALGREEGAEVVAGHGAQVRREARVAASEATRATMERQRVEAALGLLERLVAACDEATAFPRELQRRVGDIEAALKETDEESPDIPEDLVAKVAEAKRLWEANARLAMRQLVGTLPNHLYFYFTGGPTGPSACGVAERCQRATEDIPRLLRPPEHPQSLPTVSPVSMELQQLSPALLQPQVTVVAILGELLATLPRLDEEMLLLRYSVRLYRRLEDFTRNIRVTLYWTEGTWWSCNVTSDNDGPITSLSQALATYKSTPGITWDDVTMAARKWQRSVHVLVDRWAKLARAATELRSTCSDLATQAADRAATATTWARELQAKAARDGTAQENMAELGQALGREEGAEVVAGHEAQMRREAVVAASEATRATMVRQRLEATLELLERLVAACDEATAFPRELQWRLRDTESTLEGTNEASPDILEALVAKLAMAERLWEANNRLAKDHLLGTLQDIIAVYFTSGPTRPRACEVAEQCQRVIEDIPRLLQPPEYPQGVPKVFPVCMELQELSPALLQPQVTVVATLGELLDTLPRRDEILLPVSALHLYWDLVDFTRDLRVTLYCVDDTWWRCNVTSNDKNPDTTLSQALEAWGSSPGITWNDVTMATSEWQGMVSVLVDRWTRLARAATKLHNTCIDVATEAADRVGTARERQDEAAIFVRDQENMLELGQALGKEEGAEEEDWYEAQKRREAMEAASEARRAAMVRERVEASLWLLERLVAACDEATAFPRELQRRVGDIEAALKGTNEASPNVPEDLVAKVAEAERLWEANARLAKDHLLGAAPDIIKFLFNGGLNSPCEVAEQCQRAIEDIPRLVQPPEHPQSVPRVSPLSLALLQAQVTVVATLGELLATLPRRDEEMMLLLMPPGCLHEDLGEFTYELLETMGCTECLWYHCKHPDRIGDPVTSLSRALAAYKSTPWTTWFNVRMAAPDWQWLVSLPVDSWTKLASKAKKICNACKKVAIEAASEEAAASARAKKLQDKAARYGTSQENMGELGQALGREEGAKVVAGGEAQVTRLARVAATQATRAARKRERLEASLGLLERLVAACDEATKFHQELQQRAGDIKAALKGTNEASPEVPKDLVAKVAEVEWLWEANTHLAMGHLKGAVGDIWKFYFDGGRDSPTGVAERCQRAIKDIPRLLRPRPRPQGVPKVSPVSRELQELSLVLLQPQVTVVATLGELLDTLPRVDEEMLVFMSPGCPYWVLEELTNELWATMNGIDDTRRHHNVTSSDDDPVTSLSQALAAYKSTPWTSRKRVTMAASEWRGSVAALVKSWAQVTRKATKLHDTCKKVASEAAKRAATTTTWARELQDESAHDGTAQENVGELSQALGREGKVRRDAMVAASQATRATMVKQLMEAALGPLQRLVAACDEATVFPHVLQRRVGDIEASLKGTNEVSSKVPEDFVVKVAEAERLWEANARLAKHHLLGTLQDIIDFYFTGGPTGPSDCAVAERCQKATEDIPRLLRPPESIQNIPKVSPMSMELQELPLALLQPQVTVVAILGELLATLPRRDEEMLPVSTVRLYWDLVDFTDNLRITLYCTDDTWWHRNVTYNDDEPPTYNDDDPPTYNDGDPLTSLSQALAAWESTEWTTWDRVTMVASKWQGSVSVLVDRWAQLASRATKLHNTCKVVATEAANRVTTATARAWELQDVAACYGTAQENMVEQGQALGREEGAEVVAGHGAQVRREAMVAASKATRATMVRQRLEAALWLLKRLVAACDKATAFPRELQRLLGDIEAAMKTINWASPGLPEGSVAKVVEAERLWEANARLAKGHLVGAVPDAINFLFTGGPTSPSASGVAEWCKRATKDIPRLLQPPDCPQSIPKVSPVSTELHEVSPPQLLVMVDVVAILGEVAATMTGPHRATCLHNSQDSLHEDVKNFIRSLRNILNHGGVTSRGHPVVPSLGRALATLRATPGTTWACMRFAAKARWELVAKLVDSWDQLAREATKLRDDCGKVVTARQLMVALIREDVTWEMAPHDSQVAAATNEAMGEAGVATRWPMVATRWGHWAVVALEPLQRLVAACDRVTLFYWNMEGQLRDIENILKGTNDVPQSKLDEVAEFERLWRASTRLAKDHLLGILELIDNILLSPSARQGVSSDPGSCAVAERCQKAIEDIPRLLQGQ